MTRAGGAMLFARSRHWMLNLATIVASAALIAMFGPFGYSLDPRGIQLVEVAAQVPLLCALAMTASLASLMPAKEALASRDLRPWRLAHVAGLSIIACVVCGLAAAPMRSSGATSITSAAIGPVGIGRNLLALTGLALLAAALVGPTLAWVLPLAWAVVPYMALPTRDADAGGVLTLLMQPDSAPVPMVVAVALWGLGAALAISGWPRDRHNGWRVRRN